MKVLLIGSGGREHALAWKIAQSKKVTRLYAAPGNGGIKDLAELIDIEPSDIDGLIKFAVKNKIGLTVVGPEAPLVEGIVDRFSGEGLKIFGPAKELAFLEGSKIFAKETMKRFGLPTAGFKIFDSPAKAKAYVAEKGAPIVIKADGLCAGKGVVVAGSIDEANIAIDEMLTKKVFGKAGDRIIIEECLKGEEASILVFSDGKHIAPLVSSQDHKRIFDYDKGPNTGGMGAYSPTPAVNEKLFKDIINNIFTPIIRGFSRENKFYKGVLYAGLMLTDKGPYVLEFNVRFGDPETQAILPRLKTDLVDIMLACIDGTLNRIKLDWDEKMCVSVVLASKGYPGAYEKEKEVLGLENAKKINDVTVFHSGTISKDSKIFTNGGRVLAVTALGSNIESAKLLAYKAISKISFEGMQYRKDIGDKAIKG